MIFPKSLGKLLEKLLPDRSEPEAFNIQAIQSGTAVDGMDVMKLNRIIKASYHGDADELFSLYSHIMMSDTTWIAGSFQRKGPTVARDTSITAPPKADSLTVRNRDFLRGQWARCKGKRVAISHLLDASAWPVALCRKVYAEVDPQLGYYYRLAELRPVPFWLLTFVADENGPAGVLKIKTLRPDGTLTGKTELPDLLHYVVHRGHLLQSMPDCWGGPMRAVVFWWFFATLARQMAANHLESHNQPKWIAKYSKVDSEKGKRELLRAFSRSLNTTALIVSDDTKIEAVATLKGEAASAMIEFIKLCQREIAKVCIVQTGTMEAQAQGLGSSQSDVQADALAGIRDFDAALLKETFEEQVFRPLLDLNALAGGGTPTLAWGAEDDDAQVKADMLNDLKLAGIRVKQEGMEKLSGIIGLPLERVPEAGEAPMPAGKVTPFSADQLPPVTARAQAAIDRLADNTAADLAEAFGADFADLSRALRDATGPEDLLRRLQPAAAGLEPRRSARLMEDALAAASANGFRCAHMAAER